ncbi:virulence factor Mce-like protein [Marmoricola sp. URHA0025 HA25]
MSRPMSGARRLALGLTYLFIVLAAGTFAIAMNKGVFEHNTRIEVVGDRAGLTLAAGARVKFRGVDVGRVASIDPSGNGARIHVDLFDHEVRFVPSDVSAEIVPPTAFGAKYINLVASEGRDGPPIAAGAEVKATQVTTEFNEAFENLTKVMQVARPEELNNALTASARVLDGRGTELGTLATGFEEYLGELDSSLPDLSRTLHATGPVVDVYDRSADDLVTMLDNLGSASSTLSARPASFGDLLTSASQFSTRTTRFLDTNQPGIARVVTLFDPVTAALARYAPELPCTLAGAVDVNAFVERAIGGTVPGFYTYSKFRPAKPPYRPGTNLPVVREDRGPRCYGLPVPGQAEAAQPLPAFDVGTGQALGGKPPAADLADTFFGTLSGLVSGP